MKNTVKINNRKDILLLTLYSPGVTKEINDPIVGRTRLVKMLFIFKNEFLEKFKRGLEINEDEFYRFSAWNYGPFSKEVYDDINFFQLNGFVESTLSSQETIYEAADEILYYDEDAGIDNEDDYREYNEESFRLTEKGLSFTQALFSTLSLEQQKLLLTFKTKFTELPLKVILRYVYKTYPESTIKSQIKNKVLGDN